MAKKQSPKRAFDWRTYSKPARGLSEVQEESFGHGLLAPFIEWVGRDPRRRFEIRTRAAALYHRGSTVVRITGEDPPLAEFDGAPGEPAERIPLVDDGTVAHVLERAEADCGRIDVEREAGTADRNHRSYLSALAQGNRGIDLGEDGLVVVDTEYALGRRKIDLVALVRTPGVTGPGGFANPALAFVDVRSPERPLSGTNGLASTGADVAEYARAISGEHLQRTADEIVTLAAQKSRLGLLAAELDVRGVHEGLPWLVVVFAETEPSDAPAGTAIVELHERLAARHFPAERLRFLHATQASEDGDGLAVGPEDLATYREFKAYRAAR